MDVQSCFNLTWCQTHSKTRAIMLVKFQRRLNLVSKTTAYCNCVGQEECTQLRQLQ